MSRKAKRIFSEAGGDGHRDVPYGVYDRPGPMVTAETLPDFKPVVPREQVAIQLSANKPPVDDKDYVPPPGRDLDLALAALAQKVPDEEVEKFYKEVRRLVSDLTLEELDESYKSRSEIRKMKDGKLKQTKISEAGKRIMVGARPKPQMPSVKSMQKDFEEEYGSGREEEEEELETPHAHAEEKEGDVEKQLGDIAKQFGFAGPPGAKNFIMRLLARVKRYLDIPDRDLDALLDYASEEYISLLEKMEGIDHEEANFFRKNKKLHVFDLPSFKYFLGSAFIQPAAKKIENEAQKKVESYLDRLNLSSGTKATIINQLTGLAKRNDKLILSRLQADEEAGLLKQSVDQVFQKISRAFPSLLEIIDADVDIVDLAIDAYKSTGLNKLGDIMLKAQEDPNVLELLADVGSES